MAEDAPMFFVFRAAADLPAGLVPGDMLEVWYSRGRIPAIAMSVDLLDGRAIAVRTDEVLNREDGARAEVWEVRANG